MSHAKDLKRFADYFASFEARTLPTEVLENAKACLLYGLAVGIGTRRARPALLAQQAADRQRESGAVTRLIDGVHTSQGCAAFANAVLLSGRVQGDSHPCGHIGGVVIPAALAAAENAGSTGADLLSAMVAGYESALRIGRDHCADISLRGFRTTPAYGVFGAAVATGRILGFDSTTMRNAIALAANFAGGLREYVDAGTEESPFQAGFAARNGVYVADLSGCGLKATPTALIGSSGFYRAFAEKGIDYGARLTEKLGEDFEFTTVTWKQYPACQFLRGLIRGLSELRKDAAGASVKSMAIRMNPFEADFIGVRFTGPFESPAQTVMSAPFCSALAWTTGTASFDGLREFDNTAVNTLVPKINIITDPTRERYEPHIEVHLDNNRTLTWVETAGDSNYRVTWAAATSMTYQLCEEVAVPRQYAQTLIDVVNHIESLADVRPLVNAVCAATTHVGK
jgi:2-methylcitrate dehydratase PrpD